MTSTRNPLLASLALVATLGTACVDSAVEEEELVELQDAITSLSSLFDDPDACSLWFDRIWLRWYGPHQCGLIYPGNLCLALADDQCMVANPRFERFLESVCFYECEPVDPPPPPTCADCANIPPGQPVWAWAWCGCCQNGEIQQPCYVPYSVALDNES